VSESPTTVPASNEVAGHQSRLAQANRLLRFAREHGYSDDEIMAGAVDLTPICGPDGKIVPEAVDL
jgi:hypothetical protein